jgi:chemotaxis protein histidine kinase CheA
MLEGIRKQFYTDTLLELQNINTMLTVEIIHPDDYDLLIKKVFNIAHQISGTGPMLGFEATSKLSRKIERIFSELKTHNKDLSASIVLQTKRAVVSMIDTMNNEFDGQMVLSDN